MHEEQLFEMVNEAIIFAQNELQKCQEQNSFAMVLYKNGYVESVTADEKSHDLQYDKLIETLRQRVSDEPKITGIAVVATVNIPDHP